MEWWQGLVQVLVGAVAGGALTTAAQKSLASDAATRDLQRAWGIEKAAAYRTFLRWAMRLASSLADRATTPDLDRTLGALEGEMNDAYADLTLYASDAVAEAGHRVGVAAQQGVDSLRGRSLPTNPSERRTVYYAAVLEALDPVTSNLKQVMRDELRRDHDVEAQTPRVARFPRWRK